MWTVEKNVVFARSRKPTAGLGLASEQGNAWATAHLPSLLPSMGRCSFSKSQLSGAAYSAMGAGGGEWNLCSDLPHSHGEWWAILPLCSAGFKSHPAHLGLFPSFTALLDKQTVSPQPPRLPLQQLLTGVTQLLSSSSFALEWTWQAQPEPFPSVPIQISINKRCQDNSPM